MLLLISFTTQNQKFITFVTITTDFIRKTVSNRKPSRIAWWVKVVQISNLLENSSFNIGNKHLSVVFPWSDRFTLIISKKCLPNTQIWITIIFFPSFFQVKRMFCARVSSSAQTLNNLQVFFLDTTIILQCVAKVHCIYSLFVFAQNIKKTFIPTRAWTLEAGKVPGPCRGEANAGGVGPGSASGGGGGGLPSCAFGGGHWGWKRPGSAPGTG